MLVENPLGVEHGETHAGDPVFDGEAVYERAERIELGQPVRM
ncbi:MAG: hypothetical protein V3S52_01095 [Gemmatimonadota bacterium]